MTDYLILQQGDRIELFEAPKQHPLNNFKTGTKGKVTYFYENGIDIETDKGETMRLYEPFIFGILERAEEVKKEPQPASRDLYADIAYLKHELNHAKDIIRLGLASTRGLGMVLDTLEFREQAEKFLKRPTDL